MQHWYRILISTLLLMLPDFPDYYQVWRAVSQKASLPFLAQRTLWQSLELFPPPYLSFAARYMFLHILVATVLYFLILGTGTRRTWLLWIWVFFQLLTTNLVYQPQVFDAYSGLGLQIQGVSKLIPEPLVRASGISFCLLLIYRLLIRSRKTALALIAILVVAFAPLLRSDTMAVRPKSSRLNFILIGVDSLRPDSEILSHARKDSEWQRFIQDSSTFKRVISPIAITLPAFYSLFSGRNPVHTGIRHGLQTQSDETDRLLKNSLLNQLRQSGFNTSFLLDDSQYSYFRSGEVLSDFRAPPTHFSNYVFSSFFRSKLFYGFLNNSLGYLIFPEVRANAGYLAGYKLKNFVDDIKSQLDVLSLQSNPFVLTAHTCALHLPAAIPYPYYRNHTPPFSYGSTVPSLRTPSFVDQVAANRELYDSGARMIEAEYLEPILHHLRQTGLLENSVVIVFSDHGEALWDSQPFPIDKSPMHGRALVGADDSNLATLLIRHPHIDGRNISQNVGLIDVFPTILDVAGIKANGPIDGRSLLPMMRGKTVADVDYFAETGWMSATIPQQTVPPFFLQPELFFLDPIKEMVFFDPREFDPFVFQKQRAIFRGDQRLTVYPTYVGYRLSYTDLRDRPLGIESSLPGNGRKIQDMLAKLNREFSLDEKSGTLPLLYFNKSRASIDWSKVSREKVISDPRRFPWLSAQLAYEYANRDGNADLSIPLLTQALTSRDASPALKRDINDQLISLCGNLDNPAWARKLGAGAGRLEADVNTATVPQLQALTRCWRRTGRPERVMELENTLKHASRNSDLQRARAVLISEDDRTNAAALEVIAEKSASNLEQWQALIGLIKQTDASSARYQDLIDRARKNPFYPAFKWQI